jgi:pyridoxine 5-phosphate synthase
MGSRLGVCIDPVAALRQTRRTDAPDPVEAAVRAQAAGARRIVAHLREDRRHIQERDVELLRKMLRVEFNLRIAASQNSVAMALRHRPDVVTLVPEFPDALSPSGGLNLATGQEQVQRTIRMLKDSPARVSALIDPELDYVRAVHKWEVDEVEFFAGGLTSSAPGSRERAEELNRLRNAVKTAHRVGLPVTVAHGLDFETASLVAELDEVKTIVLGQSIVAQAVMLGMDQAVRDAQVIVQGKTGRS